jgi:hypothetical protein
MKTENKGWFRRLLSMVDTWGEILLLVLIYLTYQEFTGQRDRELAELLLKYDLLLVIAVGGVKAIPPGAAITMVQAIFRKK